MEIYIKYNDYCITYDDFIDIDKECFPNEYFSNLQFEELKKCDFWVAYINELPVGYILIKKHLDNIHLSRIGIRKGYRNMGVASELMNTLMKHAKGFEKAYITLLVETTNEHAISLYRKFGFSAIGGKSQFVIPIKKLLAKYNASSAIISAIPVGEHNSKTYKHELQFVDYDNKIIGKCSLNSEFPGCTYYDIDNPDINLINSLISLRKYLNIEKDILILTIDQEPLINACTSLGFKLNYELIKMQKCFL